MRTIQTSVGLHVSPPALWRAITEHEALPRHSRPPSSRCLNGALCRHRQVNPGAASFKKWLLCMNWGELAIAIAIFV